MKKFNFVIGALVFFFLSACKKEVVTTATPSAESFFEIKPPLEGVDIPMETFLINPQKDTVVLYQENRIKIPKNAFLNANGDIIKETVALDFRTLSNPLEIYLSGVPMTYNVAGEEQVFESAGMFEIQANHKGEPVYVNPENKMEVSLVSFANESNFNTYDLENDTGVWIETGKDEISKSFYDEEFKKLPKIPEPPRIIGEHAFKVEDTKGVNPDLSLYENVYFEPIDGKPCGQVYNSNIRVKDLKNGTYEVEFTSFVKADDRASKCICYLSFEPGLSYTKAMRVYRKKYGSLLAKFDKDRAILQKKWEDYVKKVNMHKEFFMKKEIAELNGTEKIIRTLEVNKFGFINVDRPIVYPQGAEVLPIYHDEKGNSINLREVVLIEIGRNTLYSYKKEVKFNPKNNNLLWGILPNGKFAYFTNADFTGLNLAEKNPIFTMRVHPKKLESYDEIMQVLFPK